MLNVFFFCRNSSSCQNFSQILSYAPALKVIPLNHWKDPWTTLGSTEKFLNCLQMERILHKIVIPFPHLATPLLDEVVKKVTDWDLQKCFKVWSLVSRLVKYDFNWTPVTIFCPSSHTKKLGGNFCMFVCGGVEWSSLQFESCSFLLRIRYTHHNRVYLGMFPPPYCSSDNQDCCNFLGGCLHVNSKP